MRKFISIFMVVLATLIMLCACEPTIGDDGGFDDDDSFKQPQTIEEMTAYLVDVSKVEGGVLYIDPEFEYVEPYNEEAISELFSSLEEYLTGEGLTAYPYVDEDGNLILRLSNETREELYIFCKPSEEENVIKKYCPSMVYPKTITSDDEIVELLQWLDENKTQEVGYSMTTMESNTYNLEFIHRSDNDIAKFKERRSTYNATYSWMNRDKTIVEKMMYDGRGRTYSYRCINIPEVIEECKKLAEASTKADYAENWRDYPVGLYTFDEFMGAVNDMGGQSAVTVYTSTFVVPMMRPIWDEEGWSMCTSFNRVTDHVIEFVRNGSYYYAVVGEEGLAEAKAIFEAKTN